MQRASDTFRRRRLFVLQVSPVYYYSGLRRRGAEALLAPTFVPALSTLAERFLSRVELCALLGCQDSANLRRLLSAERGTLHQLPGLVHVATERSAITLLASGTRRVDERLGLGAKRLLLRLILLTDRLDLRLLGIGQVEITSELAAAANLAAASRAATIQAAVRASRRS